MLSFAVTVGVISKQLLIGTEQNSNSPLHVLVLVFSQMAPFAFKYKLLLNRGYSQYSLLEF